MKTKIFGLGLILAGASCLVWIGLKLLVMEGVLLAAGAILFLAGWIIFNYASKESPKETEKADPVCEIKSGFGRIRSFIKERL